MATEKSTTITVNNLFVNVFKDALLGYIRVVQIGANNVAEERTAEGFSTIEMANLLQKEAKAHYRIGSYWYVVV